VSYYPIFVEMAKRRCLVVGGGGIAEGKVHGLLAADADVTLVAPELTRGLRELVQSGRIAHEHRDYREGDLDRFELCFVATDDGAVNEQVAAEGKRRGVWVNAADDPANCDFILPSVVRQGDVVVAASTGGASPALARRLREDLTSFLSDDYAPLADLLNEVRSEIKERGRVVDAEAWQAAMDARLRALVAQGRLDSARQYLLYRLGVTDDITPSLQATD
jgi:precorrin-2 dehydrogenase/sirohydrochlorin ferrochelatase